MVLTDNLKALDFFFSFSVLEQIKCSSSSAEVDEVILIILWWNSIYYDTKVWISHWVPWCCKINWISEFRKKKYIKCNFSNKVQIYLSCFKLMKYFRYLNYICFYSIRHSGKRSKFGVSHIRPEFKSSFCHLLAMWLFLDP